MLATVLRSAGVFEYIVNKDRTKFQAMVGESLRIELAFFERAKQGEPIDSSCLSLRAYREVLDALAIGDTVLASAFARYLGTYDLPKKKKLELPFDRCFGYAVRAFVLRDESEIPSRLDTFSKECEKKRTSSFRGYALVLSAILSGSASDLSDGFVELLKGHRRLSRASGLFGMSADADLCMWGLGIANLARTYGLEVTISDPLIPSELILP